MHQASMDKLMQIIEMQRKALEIIASVNTTVLGFDGAADGNETF